MANPLTFDQYNRLEPAAKYNEIEGTFVGIRSHTMPMSMRKLIQVTLSAQTVDEAHPLGDNRSRHIKALMAGTVGFVFTLAARVVRIAIFTLFLVPALLVRLASQTRYGIQGAVLEVLRKYGEEWIDLGITLASFPIALVKVFSPISFEPLMTTIAQHYFDRVEHREEFNRMEIGRRQAYNDAVAAAAELRRY